MAILHILWDDSHIWGLLAVRAARAMELPLRLVRGRDIAQGLFSREPPSLLLVPGGSARHKAESLGAAGLAAVRAYVEQGGQYLGFCGGAGLALASAEPGNGLGLCPWLRGGFGERLQHFMSGHLHVSLAERDESGGGLVPGELPEDTLLPVWWPGRFAPEENCGVEVLARYAKPAEDFWLADLPISDLPSGTFAVWQEAYGVSLTPSFLEGQPCVIRGTAGKGGYVLSYSHLETPDSPQANLWLAHLMHELAGLKPARQRIPPWHIRGLAAGKEYTWDDPVFEAMDPAFGETVRTGLMHGLLFTRTDWLLGWRTGIPGIALNNLLAALDAVRSQEPGNEALRFWREHKDALRRSAELFARGCVDYLLAERLSQTISRFLPGAVPPERLKERREALFGPPMRAGGLYRALMEPLDELAFLQLSGESAAYV